MKSAAICLLAATSSLAAVLPGQPAQVPLGGTGSPSPWHHDDEDGQNHGAHPSLLESWSEALRPVQDGVASALETAADELSSATGALAGFKDDMLRRLQGAADTAGHDFPDLTIYQLLHLSEHTSRFAKLVDEHADVVRLLNGTAANHTLFVPVDEAFEHLPPHHDKPSKEFIDAVLRYHVGLGNYPAARLLGTHTLPTAYDERGLGGEPQRLRTRVSLAGVHVNFYSKVIAADIGAKNGIIHAVRHLLAPPPPLGPLLALDPSHFSTLLLAYQRTDFVKYVHGLRINGSTLFAPDNAAFAALGPRANAFLFNTRRGLKCLDALLRYQIAPNATLYSDAFYDKTGKGKTEGEGEGEGDEEERVAREEHYELATLLPGASVGVDIKTVLGFRIYLVNGFTTVKVDDVVGRNGVIQVVNRVPIPPRNRRGESAWEDAGGEIEVEDLVERLAPYME